MLGVFLRWSNKKVQVKNKERAEMHYREWLMFDQGV
jgi:hypothetical protein